MTIINDIKNKMRGWVFGIALKKAIVSFVKVAISYCIAHGIKISVAIPGIGILDTNSELALTAFINSLLTVLRNWAKVKYPSVANWI